MPRKRTSAATTSKYYKEGESGAHKEPGSLYTHSHSRFHVRDGAYVDPLQHCDYTLRGVPRSALIHHSRLFERFVEL